MPGVTRWEYTRVPLSHNRPTAVWKTTLAALNEAITELGMDGWEAVGQITLTESDGPSANWLLFKRPLK